MENINEPLNKTITDIHNLLIWETDSYGSLAPRYSSIVHAENWIRRLYTQIAFGNWLNPNVTAGPEGEVVFEWWYGAKKLTVYVSSPNVEYIKVWGTDIYTDMEDGDAEPIDTCKELWSW